MKIHDLLQKQFEALIMVIHLAPIELSTGKILIISPFETETFIVCSKHFQ